MSKLVESLWITSVEKWILVRMADKMSRISTLIDQEAQVKDEAIEDTLQDLANYSIILKLYLSTKTKIYIDLTKEWVDETTISLFKHDFESWEELFKLQNSICYMDNWVEKNFNSLKEYEEYLINKYKNNDLNN